MKFWDCTHGKKSSSAEALKTRGFGGILPQKVFKLTVSEEPFPAFSAGYHPHSHSQLIHNDEKRLWIITYKQIFSVNRYEGLNAVVSRLFYPSLALWNNKRIKDLTQKKCLQGKKKSRFQLYAPTYVTCINKRYVPAYYQKLTNKSLFGFRGIGWSVAC